MRAEAPELWHSSQIPKTFVVSREVFGGPKAMPTRSQEMTLGPQEDDGRMSKHPSYYLVAGLAGCAESRRFPPGSVADSRRPALRRL